MYPMYVRCPSSTLNIPSRWKTTNAAHNPAIASALSRNRAWLSRHALYQSIVFLHRIEEDFPQTDWGHVNRNSFEAARAFYNRIGIVARQYDYLAAAGPDLLDALHMKIVRWRLRG